MKKLTVDLKEKSYDILIEGGILNKIKDYTSQYGKCFVISNKTVFDLYGKYFSDFHNIILMKDGEKYKNLDTYKYILDKLFELNIQRTDCIIALGGGVVGDVSGFCASSVLRGVDFIQIPTTLLSQVDSSVGGKTGINHKKGKNLIGAFYQPKLVLIDTNTLKTLDEKQVKTGLGEVIKYAFIEKSCDENGVGLFEFLSNLQKYDDEIDELVYKCCYLKAKVVEKDEKENGLRMILNYGHTIAHSIEKITNYKVFTHGEAVAIGIGVALKLSLKLGLIDENYYSASIKLLEKYGLNLKLDKKYKTDDIIDALKHDKKVKFDKVNFILSNGISTVLPVQDVDNTLLKECLLF